MTATDRTNSNVASGCHETLLWARAFDYVLLTNELLVRSALGAGEGGGGRKERERERKEKRIVMLTRQNQSSEQASKRQ